MIGKAALILSLVLSLAEGCQKGHDGSDADGRKPVPPFNSGPVTSLCVIDSFAVIAANNPHQSKNTPSDMVGKARVTCSQRADRIMLEVKIQRQLTDGAWSDYTKVFGLDDPIVPVEPGKPCAMQVDEMPPEWAARWAAICDRLTGAAFERGGGASSHENDPLNLIPPRRGCFIRVWAIEPGAAQVDVESVRISTTWALDDDEWEDLEQVVSAIMDGQAEITVDWRFEIAYPTGGDTAGGREEPVTYMLDAWTTTP